MLRIYGASDDLVEMEGFLHGEYSPPLDGCIRFTIGDPDADAGRNASGCVVEMAYAPPGFGGTWAPRVGMIDEDITIPWSIRVEASGYSAVVIVDCPTGTPVKVEAIDARGNAKAIEGE